MPITSDERKRRRLPLWPLWCILAPVVLVLGVLAVPCFTNVSIPLGRGRMDAGIVKPPARVKLQGGIHLRTLKAVTKRGRVHWRWMEFNVGDWCYYVVHEEPQYGPASAARRP